MVKEGSDEGQRDDSMTRAAIRRASVCVCVCVRVYRYMLSSHEASMHEQCVSISTDVQQHKIIDAFACVSTCVGTCVCARVLAVIKSNVAICI